MTKLIDLGLASEGTKGAALYPIHLDGPGVKKLNTFGQKCRTRDAEEDVLPPVTDNN